jgi:hypothetical protein
MGGVSGERGDGWDWLMRVIGSVMAMMGLVMWVGVVVCYVLVLRMRMGMRAGMGVV